MSAPDRVELELCFENGGLLRCAVEPAGAAEVVHLFHDVPGRRLVTLDTEKGHVVVDLGRVAYIRELAQRHSIGFAQRVS